ncbi:hypothetical protein K523DRAFT_358975 [Schizophyllum commune Tattone D]|nr:hypothetical protein K523DRAFT_358975 [Schizophyllum commune Tattone D]
MLGRVERIPRDAENCREGDSPRPQERGEGNGDGRELVHDAQRVMGETRTPSDVV